MKVSFVIPAHDEERHLPATLDAIARATAALALDHEVIVADDGSTDATASVAAQRGARVVGHQRRQIAATRNLGARAASGDLLVFVDADTQVGAGALAGALEAVQQGAVGGGAQFRLDGVVPRYARVMVAVTNVAFRLLRLTGGCFLFCTRRAFDAVGGWDETLYASEEITMARALKRQGRFVIVREPVVSSGRKLRTHSARELFGVLWAAVSSRGKFVKDRSRLDMWYGPRRADPGATGQQGALRSELEQALATALWEVPWVAVVDGVALVAELQRELHAGHVLSGQPVRAVARRVDDDDVLFAVGDPPSMLAVVHLTWSGRREPKPEFPSTVTHPSWDAFLRQQRSSSDAT